MEKKIVATNEQMKAEAIHRMKLIGLKEEYIEAFSSDEACEITTYWSENVEGFSPYCIEDEEEKAIVEFENNHPDLVWAVIHDMVFECGEDWDGFYLLLVSDDPGKWEQEREALTSGKPKVYFKCISSDTNTINTGFDSIGIEVKEGILWGIV